MGRLIEILRHYFFMALIISALFSFFSCQTVHPYQRAYLNDANMQMGSRMEGKMEVYASGIREGASGGVGSGKGTGGCGCN